MLTDAGQGARWMMVLAVASLAAGMALAQSYTLENHNWAFQEPEGFSRPSTARALSGDVRIIDGDTIAVGGVRVRLSGIDAPEVDDRDCMYPAGDRTCGEISSDALAGVLIEPECQVVDIDRFRRLVATCDALGRSMSEYLVQAGMALPLAAVSGDSYRQARRVAQENKLGFWNCDRPTPGGALFVGVTLKYCFIG